MREGVQEWSRAGIFLRGALLGGEDDEELGLSFGAGDGAGVCSGIGLALGTGLREVVVSNARQGEGRMLGILGRNVGRRVADINCEVICRKEGLTALSSSIVS